LVEVGFYAVGVDLSRVVVLQDLVHRLAADQVIPFSDYLDT